MLDNTEPFVFNLKNNGEILNFPLKHVIEDPGLVFCKTCSVLLPTSRVSVWLRRMRNTQSFLVFNNNEKTNLFDLCVCVCVCVITAVWEMEADGVESVSG